LKGCPMPKSNVVTIAGSPPQASSIEVLQIAVHALHPSSNNPRRTFDDAALAELQATIKGKQIHTPLIVRLKDFGSDETSYEIVAGHRRHRAAVALGMATVPCVVRELTDDEADELAIVDNLQRADVHPVEEAQAFQRLLESLGSIAAVAARLGKEQSYVAKVLRLNALTLHSQDALRGRLITVDHAMLLARLAEAEQNAALKWCLDRNAGSKTPVEKVVADRLAKMQPKAVVPAAAEYDETVDYEDEDEGEDEPGRRRSFQGYKWEPESVVRLKAFIEGESGIVLERAPWSLTDEDYLLPDVGPCAECPKNTSANAPLFGDLLTGVPVCTDGACFAAKTSGFVQIEMRKNGHDDLAKPKVLVPGLSWKSSSVKPSIVPNDIKVVIENVGRCGETANPAKLLKQGQWAEAKPGSCLYVRPGVTVDWSHDADSGYMRSTAKLRKPGETLQVCIAAGCKVHVKEWEKPKQASGNHYVKPDPAEEKRKAEVEAACVKEETKIREKLFDAIVLKLDAAKALQLTNEGDRDAARLRKELLVLRPELSGSELEAFVVFCSQFEQHFRVNSYWLMNDVANSRKEAFALAKQAGIDAAQLVAKHFHDAGSIAPACDRLYPKGVAWPKGAGAKVAPPKKVVAKKAVAAKKAAPAKKAIKAAAKKGQKAKPAKLTAIQRKRIADATKKHLAERRVKAGA
jgi:ParB family chromosome partitioning protein